MDIMRFFTQIDWFSATANLKKLRVKWSNSNNWFCKGFSPVF